MDPITALLLFGSAILSAESQRKQRKLAQQQYDQAQQAYQQNYDQLYSLLSPLLTTGYSAIPQEYIDQVVGRAEQDLSRLQNQAMDRALRDLARRGLAGSSLVDQQNVAIGERAQRALADARLQAEGRAQDLTAQQQAQARSILAGLTQSNFGAMQQAAQGLLGQASQATDTYSSLLGNLLAPGLQSWLYGGEQAGSPAPTATLSRNPLYTAPQMGADRARVRWG